MGRVPFLLVFPLLGAGAAFAQAVDQQPYVIDTQGSDIHWLVYKAGALARFGHNHVISIDDFTGAVTVNTADLSKSRFELEVPVTNLKVDDPTLRSQYGEDFASVPSADDIAGTRNNMLGDRVLKAEEYPALRITGTGPIGAGESQMLQITVELLGHSVDLSVPTKVTLTGHTLEASGEFDLSHADLGMTPFSALAGALQVADQMKFSYRIRAQRAESPHAR